MLYPEQGHAEPVTGTPMKNSSITILCSDVSMNCLSRSLTLAEILAQKRQVQIIGFACDDKNLIWPPARSAQVPVIKLEYGLVRRWHMVKREIKAIIDQSLLIICKPKLNSMGLALSAGYSPEECILDINDWELGLIIKTKRTDGKYNIVDLMSNLLSPNSALLLRYYESRIKYFPHKIVNNRWLQQRYGGELVYDVRDTDRLNPENYDKGSIRRELGLDDRQWIIFAGTPRWHKGVMNIIYALDGIKGNEPPGLMLCGGRKHREVDDLINVAGQTLGKSRFRYIPPYDRFEAGRYLAAADIACIPSLLSSHAVGQVPTKLFEAMAMGLPLVTSAICDMPDLIEGIGIPVPPGDVGALGAAIEKLAKDPDLSMNMGRQARVRAVKQYSYQAAEPVINSLLEKVGN